VPIVNEENKYVGTISRYLFLQTLSRETAEDTTSDSATDESAAAANETEPAEGTKETAGIDS